MAVPPQASSPSAARLHAVIQHLRGVLEREGRGNIEGRGRTSYLVMRLFLSLAAALSMMYEVPFPTDAESLSKTSFEICIGDQNGDKDRINLEA